MSTADKILHRAPRILGILAIVFISLFALDAFESGHTLWQQISDFILHLIPSFVLLLVLLIAWKREKLGGIIFLGLGLGLSPFVFTLNYQMNHSVWMSLGIVMAITIPFAVVGSLFIANYYHKKKRELK
jgi:peptidoglycan/LPS O-acetylase OafA/YrhL